MTLARAHNYKIDRCQGQDWVQSGLINLFRKGVCHGVSHAAQIFAMESTRHGEGETRRRYTHMRITTSKAWISFLLV